MRKSEVSLKLNKPAWIGRCILELSKVLMYEFHNDDIKINMTTNQNYYSQTLIVNVWNVYEEFSSDKEMFNFSNYSTKSKYYYDSNKLVIGKRKDETGGVAIQQSDLTLTAQV